MKITYLEKNFSAETMEVIEQANAICDTYRSQGFDLTLRQLYYQFVSRDLIPNRQQSYDRLGRIVSEARVAGLIDWDYITDRGRNLQGDLSGHDVSPEDQIRYAAQGYFEDLWVDQPRHIEVWVEKEALIDVVGRACNGLRVAHFACKGYVSQSEMWAAGVRMADHRDAKQEPLVLHLGDHDPSGIDMTRDITDRLEMFSWGYVDVKRIALNMDQIRQYQPPPNPAKITDSRAADYIANYGHESWELDALEPNVLVELIRNEVRREMDSDAWDAAKSHEQAERAKLVAVADRWVEIVDFLDGA